MKRRSLLVCLLLCTALTLQGCKDKEVELTEITFEGHDCYDVYSVLETDGFENIEFVALDDLTSAEVEDEDSVEKVTINGESVLNIGDSYPADAEVIIYYHNVKTIAIPFSSDEYPEDILYNGIVELLEKEGFSNIVAEPIEDLILGWLTKDGEIETISINGKEIFDEFESVPFDAEIIIKYHTYPAHNEDTDSDVETGTTKVIVSMNEDDFLGKNYTEAEKLLKEMGFSAFDYQIIETEDQSKPDGTVAAVEIKSWRFGDGDFSKGDEYDSDAIVVLYYYECEEKEPNLTVENCEDLKILLAEKDPQSEIVSSFASEYRGKVIEFDGNVAYSSKHGDFDTRYDILIGAGDYDEDSAIGPNFQFVDVSYYELDIDLFDYIEDYVAIGTNLHIIARVDKYNADTGIFHLDPISVVGR